MRVTFADVQNNTTCNIGANVGMVTTGNDFRALVNEAQQRLVWSGLWNGTCAEIRICATDGCITLPRQMATVETAAICSRPVKVHDFWFRYLRNGIGLRRGCQPEVNSVGMFPTFSEIMGSMSYVTFICDVVDDVGQSVLVLGYDNNNNWIRTRQNGVYQDGQIIVLAQAPGTQSAIMMSRITDIQFPQVMAGQSWLYETAANTTNRLIGQYDNDNIRPSFRRVNIPSIKPQFLQTDSNGNPIPIPVDIIGKLEFIPVVQPTDYMMIGNIPALNEMCMALNKSGNEADGVKSNQILMSGLAAAKNLLNDELSHYLGTAREVGITVNGSGMPDAEPICNFL